MDMIYDVETRCIASPAYVVLTIEDGFACWETRCIAFLRRFSD